MKTATQTLDNSVPAILDCGHPPDAGHKYNGNLTGWQFVRALDNPERKICHCCASKQVLDCGHAVGEHSHFSAGYGTRKDGTRVCYECCAEDDRQEMRSTGKHGCLYLDTACRTVGNWPGTLKLGVHHVSSSWHNFAGKNGRRDVYFTFDGQPWHGVNIGDSQITRCHKLKPKTTRKQ